MNLCDEAMQEAGETWRHAFYAMALDTALIVFFQLNSRQQHSSQTLHSTSRSRQTSDTCIRSPLSATGSHTEANNSHSTSAHMLPPPTLDPSDDVSHCPDPSCPARFTGSSQKGNLQRHLKTALPHNQEALHKCDLCQETFNRTDNLQQHLRRIHKTDPHLKRKTTRSRRKDKDTGG